METIGYILIFYLTHLIISQGLTIIVNSKKDSLIFISSIHLFIGIFLPTTILLLIYFLDEYRLLILLYFMGLAIITGIVSFISLVKIFLFRTTYLVSSENIDDKKNRRIVLMYILILIVVIALWIVLYNNFGIQRNES